MSRSFHIHGDKLKISFRKTPSAIIGGLILACAGATIIALKWQLPEIDPTHVRWGCITAIIAGLIMTTLRTGAIVDRSNDTVARWTGLIVPMLFRKRKLNPKHVRLHTEKVRYRGHVSTWYPITLNCSGGNIILGNPDAIMSAWAIAQAVATHLGIELVDETEEHPDY